MVTLVWNRLLGFVSLFLPLVQPVPVRARLALFHLEVVSVFHPTNVAAAALDSVFKRFGVNLFDVSFVIELLNRLGLTCFGFRAAFLS